jgi:hypothetical protein
MLSDILGKLVYPALEKSQACEKPAGPSAFSGRLYTVMARLTCFKSAAKPENQPFVIAQHAIG